MTRDQRLALAARLQKGWPLCGACGQMISYARLEALPATETCVHHSREGRYIGVPVYGHKTAPEVGKVKTDPDAEDGLGESARQLLRGYHRGR